jgi:hypothetical protein
MDWGPWGQYEKEGGCIRRLEEVYDPANLKAEKLSSEPSTEPGPVNQCTPLIVTPPNCYTAKVGRK